MPIQYLLMYSTQVYDTLYPYGVLPDTLKSKNFLSLSLANSYEADISVELMVRILGAI